MTIVYCMLTLWVMHAPQDTGITIIEQIDEPKALPIDSTSVSQIAPEAVSSEFHDTTYFAHREAPQLTKTNKSVDAPDSGSTRSQGRNVTTEALKGNDRCDGKNSGKGNGCDNSEESRSIEFSSTDTPAGSAEQKLLDSQRAVGDGSVDVNTATRRLASGEVDSSNIGMAASALGTFLPEDKTDKETDKKTEPATPESAIIPNIINMLQPQQ